MYIYLQTNENAFHSNIPALICGFLKPFLTLLDSQKHLFQEKTFSAAYQMSLIILANHMNVNPGVWLKLTTLQYICAVSSYVDYYTIMTWHTTDYTKYTVELGWGPKVWDLNHWVTQFIYYLSYVTDLIICYSSIYPVQQFSTCTGKQADFFFEK